MKNENELLAAIFDELKKEHNKGKKLEQIIFEEFGFKNTNLLIDEFTMFIINEYEYYRSPASTTCTHDYDLWREAVIILEQLQPRLF